MTAYESDLIFNYLSLVEEKADVGYSLERPQAIYTLSKVLNISEAEVIKEYERRL